MREGARERKRVRMCVCVGPVKIKMSLKHYYAHLLFKSSIRYESYRLDYTTAHNINIIHRLTLAKSLHWR